MNLKNALLKPHAQVENLTLLGVEVNVRRLTVSELDDYDKAIKEAASDHDGMQASLAGAKLLLSALCDEAGNKLPENELPTAKELLSAHDTPAFINAMTTLQKYCYGSLEEAKKN